MSLIVNTNVSSLNAQRNLTSSGNALATSLQRLSSGLRVNSAKDDAAGLAIADGMESQVRGSNQAIRNANDGISLLQTAEGAMSQIEANTQRIRELAVQAGSDTLSTSNRTQMTSEVTELMNENKRLVDNTKFNGINLLDATGGTTGAFTFQVGAGDTANDQITATISDQTKLETYVTTNIDLTSVAKAQTTITNLDKDLDSIATLRATLGASQNRFQAVVSNLQNFSENMSAAKSRILDTDFAAESATLTRNQIIQQAGTAMLSQANQLPQAALSLLK